MYLSILLIVLTLAATTISSFYEIKDREGKSTRIGKVLILILITSSLIAGIQLVDKNTQEREQKYYLRDSDFSLIIEASIMGFEKNKFLESSPESLKVQLVVPDSGGTKIEFIMKPLPGFVESGYSRGTPTNLRYYKSESSTFTSTNKKYLWDLNEATFIQTRSPKYSFSSVTRENGIVASWKLEGKLSIMDKKFDELKPNSHSMEFTLKNLADGELE